jgi:hypothetical protein
MMQISVVIRNVRRWAWWLALLCVAALVLAAQSTRSVKGIVCDQNGNPLKGAVVQLTNTRTLWIRSCISQRDGSYQFQRLNRDVDYELSASYHQASGRVKTLSMFDEWPVAFINLRITVGRDWTRTRQWKIRTWC